MGLLLVASGQSIPHATRLTLVCDGAHDWPQPCQVFEHTDGYVGQHRLAMNAGWKDTSLNGCRVLYGPCCSGKVTDAAS